MALGKGLGAILEEVGEAYANEMVSTEDLASSGTNELVAEIDISLVDPNPYQPRKHFDKVKLEELSESIKEHGLLQPVVVVAHGDRYILIAGERRLRAHKLASIELIKAIIADLDFDEIKMRELALIENIQRENLNSIELANSYQELIIVHEITHEELSKIVHKSRSQITNTMRLLSLCAYAQDNLISNKITQGHAKVLVGLDESKQRIVVDTIIGQKLSVRDTEQLMQNKRNISPQNKKIPLKTTQISSIQKNIIKEELPFDYKIKRNSLEIMLPNEEEVMKFISFIENS